jgi:hypothetical protein
MRSIFSCTAILLVVLGAAVGQSPNAVSGPQYLPNGSPLFARSISTPSISLSGPPLEVGADNATGVLHAGAETQTTPLPHAVDEPQFDLYPIFYGIVPVRSISVDFSESLSRVELPPSILDTGVWQLTTAQALRERGFGLTLGEAGKNSKARIRHATRVYTNADIDRLHQGS